MGNLMTSFYSGVSGLHAAQTSLNTASHNISNAEVRGYTRQQVIQTDKFYTTAGRNNKLLMQVGLGTDVADVRQVRDRFLDERYRLEIGRESFYEVQQQTCEEIEDLFGELEGVEFQESMGEFWKVLETAKTQSDSIVDRELLISTASSFLEKAKTLAKQLNDYQVNLNKQITQQVNRINEIGELIYDINKKISRAEASGEDANDLRDQRNDLMDELAEYTHFTYEEDKHGIMNIYIENAPFVTSTQSFHLKTEPITDAAAGAQGKMLRVVWADNGCGEVYDTSRAFSAAAKTDIGSLRGILTARGDFVANYTDIPVEPKEKDYLNADGDLDRDAYRLAMRKYEQELEVYNNRTGNSVITAVQAQFDTLIHGMVTMINDLLCPNVSVNFANNLTGTDQHGNTVNLGAGTYRILDVNNCPVGTDENETYGEELFTRRGVDRYTIIDLAAPIQVPVYDENGNPKLDENGNPVTEERTRLYVYKEEDPADVYSLYSIGELEINQKVLDDYSYLAVKKNPSTGEYAAYDFEVYKKMVDAWSSDFRSLDPNTAAIYDMNEYYQATITALANKGMVYGDLVTQQEGMVNSVENKRQQISGVSTEEEMVSLIKFQHSYSAASRYMTVIDEMLEHLIMRLGS